MCEIHVPFGHDVCTIYSVVEYAHDYLVVTPSQDVCTIHSVVEYAHDYLVVTPSQDVCTIYSVVEYAHDYLVVTPSQDGDRKSQKYVAVLTFIVLLTCFLFLHVIIYNTNVHSFVNKLMYCFLFSFLSFSSNLPVCV
jgi:hypothetical protein